MAAHAILNISLNDRDSGDVVGRIAKHVLFICMYISLQHAFISRICKRIDARMVVSNFPAPGHSHTAQFLAAHCMF